MKTKTISGHYGSTYSVSHNNRDLISKNVDPSRCHRNYCPVMAGHTVSRDYPRLATMPQLWDEYRRLSGLYWDAEKMHREFLEDPLQEELDSLYEIRACMRQLSRIPLCAVFQLFLLPLTIAGSIMLEYQIAKTKEELYSQRFERYASRREFRKKQTALREVLRTYDRAYSTTLLQDMDQYVIPPEV